jgi:hypothetical protein
MRRGPLDDPLATGSTEANGIFGNTIVGYYEAGLGSHGFSETNGVYTTLDDPLAQPGTTFVTGISGDTVVGNYSDGSIQHWFTESAGIYTTIDAPLGEVLGIDGSTAVGWYNIGEGFHGFVTSIDVAPEPAALGLLGSGTLMLIFRRRKSFK